MQTFKKAPHDRPDQEEAQSEDRQDRPGDEHGAAPVARRGIDGTRSAAQRVQQLEDGGGDLVGGLAAGLDHGVGQPLVERRTDLEDSRDLGDRPVGGQGGPRGQAARVGLAAGAPARRDRPSARR